MVNLYLIAFGALWILNERGFYLSEKLSNTKIGHVQNDLYFQPKKESIVFLLEN